MLVLSLGSTSLNKKFISWKISSAPSMLVILAFKVLPSFVSAEILSANCYSLAFPLEEFHYLCKSAPIIYVSMASRLILLYWILDY